MQRESDDDTGAWHACKQNNFLIVLDIISSALRIKDSKTIGDIDPKGDEAVGVESAKRES